MTSPKPSLPAPPDEPHALPALGMVLVVAAWGVWSLDPIVVYLIGGGVPRLLLAGATCLMGGVAFGYPVVRLLLHRRHVLRGRVVLLLVHGILFSGMPVVCYVTAVRYMNPGLVGTILRTQVALNVLLAAVVLKERMNRVCAIGILLNLAANGALLVVAIFGTAGGSRGEVLGWVFAFAASVLWGVGTVVNKHLLHALRPGELLGARFLIAGSVLTAASLILEGAAPLADLTTRQWLLLCAKGAGTSALGYWLYFHGLKRVEVYVASALEPAAPVFTLLVAWLWLQKPVPLPQLLCVAALLLSAAVVVLGKARKRREA